MSSSHEFNPYMDLWMQVTVRNSASHHLSQERGGGGGEGGRNMVEALSWILTHVLLKSNSSFECQKGGNDDVTESKLPPPNKQVK